MARIAGVDLPRGKRVDIALTYIYGIGRTTAMSAPLSFCLPCRSNCPILIPNSIPFFDGAFARACSCNCVLAQASAQTSLQCIMPTLCLDSAALGICLPVAVLFQIWATPGCIRNVKHGGARVQASVLAARSECRCFFFQLYAVWRYFRPGGGHP